MIAILLIIQTLRIAIPYVFASMGGVISERAGMIALSLEGYMLTGAFCAAIGAYYTDSAWMGVLAGMAGGTVMALIYAVSTVKYRADQVVIGIAINLMAIGATRFFLRLAFDSAANSPRIAGFGDGVARSDLLALGTSPLFWMAVASVLFVENLDLDRTTQGSRRRRWFLPPPEVDPLHMS